MAGALVWRRRRLRRRQLMNLLAIVQLERKLLLQPVHLAPAAHLTAHANLNVGSSLLCTRRTDCAVL